MDKQKLLDQVQAAKDYLDEAAYEDKYKIGNIINAVSQLADVLEQVIPALAGINDKLQANETRERLLDDVFSLDGDEDY